MGRESSRFAAPVRFSAQLILRIECPDGEIWLINPFNGESLSEHMLDVWLKGNISPSAELFYEDLDEADNIEVIRKLLDTLKASLMEENQMELALPAKLYYNSTRKIPMKFAIAG